MLYSAQRRPLLYAMAIFGLAPVGGLAQHVHGVIELGVVVEGGTVAVSLNAPLSDVVGFEHAPENDEQLERVRQAAAVLSKPDAMFGLTDSSNCTISDASVDGPAWVTEHLAKADAHSAESDHDDRDEHDSHGAEPAHDEHEESAAHEDEHEDEHADSEEHAEINANYQWVCGNAANLDSLALRFTESFAGVETIEIQILTPAGAQVLTVEGRAASVPLTPR